MQLKFSEFELAPFLRSKAGSVMVPIVKGCWNYSVQREGDSYVAVSSFSGSDAVRVPIYELKMTDIGSGVNSADVFRASLNMWFDMQRKLPKRLEIITVHFVVAKSDEVSKTSSLFVGVALEAVK